MKRGRQIARVLRRGFTLIEMIVVIAVIAILAAIALMVGTHVMQRGRQDLTRSLIRLLDQTQESYQQDRDGKIPYKWTDTSAQKNEFAILDGRLSPTGTNDIVEPSTTFYLLATQDSTSAASIVKGLDARFVVRAPISAVATAPANYDPTNFTTIYTKGTVQPATATAGEQVFGLVVKDAWGNAIRYVHPKFQGGYGAYMAGTAAGGSRSDGNFTLKQNGADVSLTFRRSYQPAAGAAGDADEGLCQGSRGYFYSPGMDKDAGTRGDNVYLDGKPSFPKETAKY